MSISPQIFETIMLICFGSSWPFAIMKSFRTKSVNGKSIIFLALIFGGYIAGIIYKLLGNFDRVIWLYLFNSSMILTEILLYFKYRRLSQDQAADKGIIKRCKLIRQQKNQGSNGPVSTRNSAIESTKSPAVLRQEFPGKQRGQNGKKTWFPIYIKLVAALCAMFLYYYLIVHKGMPWKDAAAMAVASLCAVCIIWIGIAAFTRILLNVLRNNRVKAIPDCRTAGYVWIAFLFITCWPGTAIADLPQWLQLHLDGNLRIPGAYCGIGFAEYKGNLPSYDETSLAKDRALSEMCYQLSVSVSSRFEEMISEQGKRAQNHIVSSALFVSTRHVFFRYQGKRPLDRPQEKTTLGVSDH